MTDATNPHNMTLQIVWPEVRSKHLYPELPFPKFSDKDAGAGLRMRSKRIILSLPFVDNLSASLPPPMCIEALLDHAVSRYLYCPWDLFTHLSLYAEVRRVLENRRQSQAVTDAFMDIAADARCASRVPTPLPQLYAALKAGGIDRMMKGVLQRMWHRESAESSGDEQLDIVPQLALLPYLDRSRWIPSIRRFALLLKPHLPALLDENSDSPRVMSGGGLESYSHQEACAGFRKLATRLKTPSEFIQIAEDFQFSIDADFSAASSGAGTGGATGSAADIMYYLMLAENYRLPVRRMPLRKSGATYPHHHAAWEVGQPCRDIDPWTSFGKIMPGITQIWQRKESNILTRKEKIPDLLVMIDSSSSMRNPSHRLSYAVLGAGCASDAYLRNGARVAVYNFGDATAGGKKILSWSTRREQIYRTLCHYIGGGTRIIPEDLQQMQISPAPDIFLITDMQITNLSILIDYLNACSNRITVVHMGRNAHVHRFMQNTGVRPGLSLFRVNNREDIPKIVLGKVREYLGVGFV